jgi:hypothetical protein
VLREWNRVGRVRFNARPWPTCTATSTFDIRIGKESPGSGAAGRSEIGTDALSIPAGQATMRLLFGVPTVPCESTPTTECPTDDPTAQLVGVNDFTNTTLHEFGHALGLRHEHAHELSTCGSTEQLDGGGLDGQSIFAYDASSVMNYCSSATVLSSGDIRALHALYPGVVGLYSDANFAHGTGGTQPPILLGPGYFTTATVPLNTISSIVVPPAYRVRICTATSFCALATTNRVIPAPFNNAIANIEIIPTVLGFDFRGFQGTSGVLTTRNSPWGALIDNAMESFYVPPTRAATVCTGVAGTGTCFAPVVGGSPPTAFRLPPGVENEVSSATVTNRAVTYSGTFAGASSALGLGIFRANGNAPFLESVRTLAISELEVRACTLEGTFHPALPGGAGDCRTYTKSVDLVANGHFPIRYLQIKAPPVVAP